MRRVVVALPLFVIAAAAAAQDVPVFSGGIEVVRVDVSVLRDGEPVLGLRAEDFEVRDNGVRQSVEIVGDAVPGGRSDKQVDVVLALDVSDSVRGEPLEQLKAAARALVDMLRPDDSFSLLTFSSRVKLAVSPADSRERAHEVIDATQAGLVTSLYDAVFAAVVTADASRGRSLVLVLSDGEDHGSWLKPGRVLHAAEGSDLVVHVVRTGAVSGESPFLAELATATGGGQWRADYGELRAVLQKALEEFRSRYTLSYERKGEAKPGWHAFDVRVKRSGVKVRARKGYMEEDRSRPVTRQTTLPTSSATSTAPRVSSATPTGRPKASPFSVTNPASRSTGTPCARCGHGQGARAHVSAPGAL
jgi:VWFA-related protein